MVVVMSGSRKNEMTMQINMQINQQPEINAARASASALAVSWVPHPHAPSAKRAINSKFPPCGSRFVCVKAICCKVVNTVVAKFMPAL